MAGSGRLRGVSADVSADWREVGDGKEEGEATGGGEKEDGRRDGLLGIVGRACGSAGVTDTSARSARAFLDGFGRGVPGRKGGREISGTEGHVSCEVQ